MFSIVKFITGGILCILWFAVIHVLKLFRMYLVLMEQKTGFVPPPPPTPKAKSLDEQLQEILNKRRTKK